LFWLLFCCFGKGEKVNKEKLWAGEFSVPC
jgi:hypothetical protein